MSQHIWRISLGLFVACIGCGAEVSLDGRVEKTASPQSTDAPSVDAAVADVAATRASIVIDGVECADATTATNASTFVYENWWILYLDVPRCNASLQISGVTDRPYPQVGVLAHEGQEVMKLFTRLDPSTYEDEHLLSHLSTEGHESTVTMGPTGAPASGRVVAHGVLPRWSEWTALANGQDAPAKREVTVDISLTR